MAGHKFILSLIVAVSSGSDGIVDGGGFGESGTVTPVEAQVINLDDLSKV